MNVSDEIIWSAVSAIVVGFVLKSSEYFISRKNIDTTATNTKIDNYHESLEDELQSLREDNRALREEAARYRKMYTDLFELMYNKDPGGKD